jgi:hypothetical protein
VDTSQHPAVTDRILAALAPVDDLRRRCEAFSALSAFPPGSAAAGDAAMSTLLGAEPVRLAMVQVANSLDHLVTWRHIMTKGLQPTVAHMTLLRGSMEASVLARWLVDPAVQPAERLARAAEWLREDYRLRRRVEELAKIKPVPPGKSAVDRIADLDAEVAILALRVLTKINLTDLFRSYSNRSGDVGEINYSILSAFAHSRSWASLLLTATKVGTGVAPGGAVMRTSADDKLALAFTVHAVRTAALAAEDIERLLAT